MAGAKREPEHDPAAARTSGTGPSGTGGKPPRRALVVEDDAILAMMIAETLQELGAEKVSVCPSMASALAEFDRLQPDLLVLDVHLADRDDGWTIAELVRELNPAGPTIVFSTASPERIPARIALLGTVLAKPFTTDQLAAAIATETHARRGFLARLRGAFGSDSGQSG